MKRIEKIAKAKFSVTTEGVLNSNLLLDFNPLIDEFKLSGDFYLIHWQARPKGYRQYGIYSSKDDSYRSLDHLPTRYGGFSLLQLDDLTATTIPSAAIGFRGHL